MLRNASRVRFPHGLLRFDSSFPRNWDLISERTFQLSFLLLFSSGSRWEASVQLSSSASGRKNGQIWPNPCYYGHYDKLVIWSGQGRVAPRVGINFHYRVLMTGLSESIRPRSAGERFLEVSR